MWRSAALCVALVIVSSAITATDPCAYAQQALAGSALRRPARIQHGLSFSHDGAFVATCGDRVRVFEIASGKMVADFDGPKTRSIVFSPVARETLAVGGEDGMIRIRQVGDPNELRDLKGHDGWVHSLTFSADGRLLASGSTHYRDFAPDLGQFRLWDVATGRILRSLDVPDGDIEGISFSSNGQYLAYCRNVNKQAGTVNVHRVDDWQSVGTYQLPLGSLKDNPYGPAFPFGRLVRFSPDGQRLFIAGGACVPASPEQLRPYKTGCTPTGLLWTADLNNPTSVKLVKQPRPGYYFSYGLSPDGRRFVTDNGFVVAARHQHIEQREVTNGGLIWSTPAAGGSHIYGVSYSPDGRLVAACGGAKVFLADAETGTLVREIVIGE